MVECNTHFMIKITKTKGMIKTLKGKVVILGSLLVMVLASIMGVLWIYGERAGLGADFGEVNLMQKDFNANPIFWQVKKPSFPSS